MTAARRRVRRKYPDTMADVRARLFTHLRGHIGPATDEHLTELLKLSNAWSPQGARVLDGHLKAHPDAFNAPDAHCPRVLVRLAASMHAAGHQVVRPRCARCGELGLELPRLADEGRCCEWCLTRERLTVCVRCGLPGFPTAKRAEGSICRRCYNEEKVEYCARCGKQRPPSTRDAHGRALCWACNPRPDRVCSGCGQLARAKVGKRGDYLCQRCYQRHQHPKRPCGICGVESIIVVRGRGDGEDRCRRCRVAPTHQCWHCAQLHPAKAMWPVGPVCRRCHRRVMANPAPCAQCGAIKVLIGRTSAGVRICGPCAGGIVDYVCADCGQAGLQYYGGTCVQCSARRLAHELLSGSAGLISEFLPLVETICVEKRALSSLRWMSRPGPTGLLRQLARLGRAPTHADLDELPPSNSLHHLRHLMVYARVLPERVEPLERIEPWLVSLLSTLPAHQATLIGPYSQWSVLRTARRRAVRRTYTFSSADRDRFKITAAVGLLEWLEVQQVPLHALSQSLLEVWLEGNGGRVSAIVGFIAWLNSQRITDALEVHQRPHPEPSHFPDPEHQLGTIEALLSETCSLTTEVRVAALLVLLYGATVTGICSLTVDDLSDVNGKSFLALATHPVLLPPTVAVLIAKLAIAARRSVSRRDGPRYLFPSHQRIGSHISAGSLTRRLNEAGIYVRVNRSGALLTLAQDLPAPVLAELLGLHISTASRWCRIAQRDWSYYLSARSENVSTYSRLN